jgi:amidophosphoribosyltransferase
MDALAYSDNDGIHEACGIFAIYAPEIPVAQTVSIALVALQHRGQESCGIVTSDACGQMNCYKGIGLVSQVFNSEDTLKTLKGDFGIGHTRYSTAGAISSPMRNDDTKIVRARKYRKYAASDRSNLLW